jgi:hypothetical protein
LLGAAIAILLAAFVALEMTRWLPATATGERAALGPSVAETTVGELVPAAEIRISAIPRPARDGSARSGLERIAVLLEEIESRRAREAQSSGRASPGS